MLKMLAWFSNYRVRNNTSTYNQKFLSEVITRFLLNTYCHDFGIQTVYALNRTVPYYEITNCKTNLRSRTLIENCCYLGVNLLGSCQTLVMDRIQYGFNNCCFSWVYVFKLIAYKNILEENISSSNWWNISIKPLF